jgi:transcriptional regulator with XRE-family HTH domain
MAHDDDAWIVRDPEDLGALIRHHRKQRGLAQQQLADAAGFHRTYLSELERGKATEQTARLFRVLRRLGLEVVVRRAGDR